MRKKNIKNKKIKNQKNQGVQAGLESVNRIGRKTHTPQV